LPIDEATATEMLRMAYIQQVALRGKEAVLDQYTEQSIRKIGRWLTSETGKPMLLLYGGVGNGKTTMARAITSLCKTLHTQANSQSTFMMNDKQARELYRLQSSIRVPQMFTAQEIANIATEDRDRFEAIGKFSSLIIDDLGCEPSVVKNFGTEVTPVTDILYRRYDAMLTTIVTTNLPAKTIREVYGNRIADRFNEVFDTIGYINPSYR